jgi:hypothetical protein
LGEKYKIFPILENGMDIHSNPNWIKRFRNIEEKYKNYNKFTIVRNPFERLVSCYNDKVIFDLNNIDNNKYYFKNYPIEIAPNISFNKFVKIISKIPDFLADRHFKSQYYSITKKKGILFDFIGKVENIKNDWKLLANQYGFNENLAHKNKTSFFGLKNKYFEYYDLRTFKRVYKRYKNDIVNLGYEEEYQQLFDYIKNKNG